MIQRLAKDTGVTSVPVPAARAGTPSWMYYATLGVLGISLGVLFKEHILGGVLYPIQELIARITASLLSLIDIQVIQQGTDLVHLSGFACAITPGCTGLVPVILFAVAVLMYPAPASKKTTGLLTGIPFLVAVNFIRLVHLVYIGTHHITWFDVMHEVIWQSLIALTVVAAWWAWTSWIRRA